MLKSSMGVEAKASCALAPVKVASGLDHEDAPFRMTEGSFDLRYLRPRQR